MKMVNFNFYTPLFLCFCFFYTPSSTLLLQHDFATFWMRPSPIGGGRTARPAAGRVPPPPAVDYQTNQTVSVLLRVAGRLAAPRARGRAAGARAERALQFFYTPFPPPN